MRLIDADALADNIAVLFERNQALIDEWLMYHVEDAIDEAPTIDAEPVVRCKDCILDREAQCPMNMVEIRQEIRVSDLVRCIDCKYRNVEDGFCEGRGWPMQLVPDDGFCDKGEWRR